MVNKRLKRMISIVLSLVLMLSIVPVASAQEDYAASVNGVGYATVAQAVAKANGGVVKLLKDSQEQVTANGDLYLDLNGHTLAGLTMASGMLYGMDSTTDDYDCSNGYGKIQNLTGSYAPNYKTDITGAYRRYLSVNEGGAVSFHRIYLGLVYVSVRPNSKGVGYKAVFAGDSKVRAQLDPDEAFGYTLQLDGYRSISAWKPISEFKSLKEVTMLLQNFDATNYGQTAVYASVQMKLKSGTVISSASFSTTLRSVVETLNDTYSDYAELQIDMLATWIKAVPAMQQWRTENILPKDINGPTIKIPRINAAPGETVTIAVELLNNPGVAGANVEITFDSGLKLSKAESGTALAAMYFSSNEAAESPFCCSWDSMEGEIASDGSLVVLTFEVPQEAISGDVFAIGLSYRTGDIYNNNWDDVNFDVVAGKIIIK